MRSYRGNLPLVQITAFCSDNTQVESNRDICVSQQEKDSNTTITTVESLCIEPYTQPKCLFAWSTVNHEPVINPASFLTLSSTRNIATLQRTFNSSGCLQGPTHIQQVQIYLMVTWSADRSRSQVQEKHHRNWSQPSANLLRKKVSWRNPVCYFDLIINFR